MIKLPNSQTVDDDPNAYRLEGSAVSCRIHGRHTRSAFHYPSETDRRTYYICVPCFEEALGGEFKEYERTPTGGVIIKW